MHLWDKTFKYMKKCYFQNFKIFMGSPDKKSIDKLFLTKISNIRIFKFERASESKTIPKPKSSNRN